MERTFKLRRDHMNKDGLNYVSTNLGQVLADGTYMFSEDCVETLTKLSIDLDAEYDDDALRRKLHAQNVVQCYKILHTYMAYLHVPYYNNDKAASLYGSRPDITDSQNMIPMLLSEEDMKDFAEDEQKQILLYLVKILSNLSQPLSHIKQSGTSPFVQLCNTGEKPPGDNNSCVAALLSHKLMHVLIGRVTTLTGKMAQGSDLTSLEVDLVNHTLYIYRNLLYVMTDRQSRQENTNAQESCRLDLLRGLFNLGIDDILITLTASNQSEHWAIVVVQLLSLLFHTDDTCTTDSDSVLSMGSSTSSSESVSVITVKMAGEQQAGSTQGDSGNTSPDGNNKGITVLVDAMNSSMMKIAIEDLGNGTGNHFSAITLKNQLDLFAEKFIQNGFSELVECLQKILMAIDQVDSSCKIEHFYLPWLITCFLKRDAPQKHDINSFRGVLNEMLVDYLVALIQVCYSHLLCADETSLHYAGILRNFMLMVNALERIFRAILDWYNMSHLDDQYKCFLLGLQDHIVKQEEIRKMFVWMIRTSRTDDFSLAVLQKLIAANHKFLLMADNVSVGRNEPFSIHEHLQENFANRRMMNQYGAVLKNHEAVPFNVTRNILNMMYHVAGDLDHSDALMQITILQTFIELLSASNMPFNMDEYGLMHQTVEKCGLQFEVDTKVAVMTLCSEYITVKSGYDQHASMKYLASLWSDSDKQVMVEIIQETVAMDATVSLEGLVQNLAKQSINKSKKEVALFLYQNDLLTYNKLLEELKQQPMTNNDEKIIRCLVAVEELGKNTEPKQIPSLDDVLNSGLVTNKMKSWLIKQIIDLLYIRTRSLGFHVNHVQEALATFCVALKKPFPLIPYTEEEQSWLDIPMFRHLLHHLGCTEPDQDQGRKFYEIPKPWSVLQLEEMVTFIDPNNLGNVEFEKLSIIKKEELNELYQEQNVCSDREHSLFKNIGKQWHRKIQLGNHALCG